MRTKWASIAILDKEEQCGERRRASLRIQKYECRFTLSGNSDAGNAVFIRISAGQFAARRLVLKF